MEAGVLFGFLLIPKILMYKMNFKFSAISEKGLQEDASVVFKYRPMSKTLLDGFRMEEAAVGNTMPSHQVHHDR